MRELGKQTRLVSLCLILVFASVAPLLLPSGIANAATQITDRKLTLVAGASDGGSKPGGTVKHEFTFTLPSTTAVGSIKFEYCMIASGVCDMPVGLNTASATIDAQSGPGASSWALVTGQPNGTIVVHQTALDAHGSITIRFNGVVNPTAANTSFFTRISTYVAEDGTGTAIDAGTVTASTANPIEISGVMPESLIFCTGATVTANCTSADTGTITFDQLFSPTDTATAHSQMAASTNAGQGYAITVSGGPLTSGSNTIPSMATAATGTRGTSQFGMNLVANTTTTSTTPVGTAITPASEGVDLKGQALTGYNTPDTFKYVSGDTIANSAYDGDTNTTLGPTNSQVYTTSYIVNVAGNQMAGTYTTTLTYICTPTF